MTKHDLKELAAMGAELGAAKAENEKLRGLLERIRTTCCQVRDAQDLDTAPGLSAAESLHEQIEKLDAALSQQAEPECRCSMRERLVGDGCSICNPELAAELEDDEPAPAQQEREAPQVVATAILGGLFHGGSGPELGEIDIEVCTPALEAIQCETVDGSDDVFLPLMTVAQHERIVAALTRPAQTEQREQEPFWYAVVSEQAPTINSAIKRLDVAQEFADSKREHWPDTRVVPLYAAPIAQTGARPGRDREADRARFPDPTFNKWLDEVISDAGHTVWDQVNVCDAWAGWENRQWYTAPQHSDDEAVDRFTAAMKAKLAAARAKGRGGWDDASVCTVEFLAQLLVEHLGKGNAGTFEDVANFAMMLHQRGADPKVLADAFTYFAQPAQAGLDTQRLDFMVSQRAHINSQNGTASPTVYRVCWTSEGRQQADWYPSERAAIDAAISAQRGEA